MNGKFAFDPASHIYSMDGKTVPGVTRTLDHSGLVDLKWVREEILERKSALGKEVHRAIHYHLEGDLDPGSVDEAALPYLESFIKLQEQAKLWPTAIEHQCVSYLEGLPFGMQCDIAGKFWGEEAIMDFKTGKAQFWHGVQLAAYAVGLPHATLTTPMAKFAQRKRYVIELQKTSEMAHVVPFRDMRDLRTFGACLEVTSRKMAEGMKLTPLEG
jgi:hypothetical protein